MESEERERGKDWFLCPSTMAAEVEHEFEGSLFVDK